MREYKPLIDNSFFCTTKKDYEFFGVFPSDPKQMVWTSAWAGCNAGYSFIQTKKSVRVFTDAFSPKKRRFFSDMPNCNQIQPTKKLYTYVNTKKTESHII